MVSFETCKKLQEEIIALIGDNLLEDDEFFLNLLSQSNDSKGVLELASELKEAGVSLFKKGHLDDALEKYGYAAMVLARYQFEEECDRLEFLKLAISNLMNSVLCFSKKKEFVEVGRICSIVLEFDPYNVKAMYRRAVAAIELGKRDWARLDLWMALDVDPNNKEVIKKLEELKGTPSKENSINHCHGAVPFGLGTCLPPPKGKKNEVMEELQPLVKGLSSVQEIGVQQEGRDEKIMTTKQEDKKEMLQGQASKVECPNGSVVSEDNSTIIEKEDFFGEIDVDTKVQDEFKENDSTIIDGDDGKGEMIVDAEGKDHLVMSNTHMEDCQEISKDMSPSMEGGREEITEMVEDKSSIAEAEDQLSCVCNSEIDETMILEEPKYRFYNRRKNGSNISLSRRDYLLLTERKTLRYFNAKSGSYMEVRICNNPARVPSASEGDHKQQALYSATSGQPSSTKEKQEKQDKVDSMEECYDAYSCVTSDDDQGSYETSSCGPRNGDGSPSHTKKHAVFCFSAYSTEAATRKSYSARMKTNKSPRNKRRKILLSDSMPSFAVNLYCGCRFAQDRKRKNVHPIPMDSYHQVRKRGRYTPPPICSSESSYCTNVGNVASVGYCHELPYSNVSCTRIDCREQVGASRGDRYDS